MYTITWDPDKNQQLQRERDVSFDDVLLALMTDQVLADIPHPRPERYPVVYPTAADNYFALKTE